MTLFKCQEARNLVRKPAIISLDSDQKIQRIDEYLKADLKELKMIIKVYNKTNIKSIHHEILWQIIKQIHVRLDFDDPSRNWVKIIKMVMEQFNIFDSKGKRMKEMEVGESRRKKAHMLRYVDEILMNVLFVVLHSGRGFFDLETRKMNIKMVNRDDDFEVFTFGIIQEMLDAVKKAVGGIMKFDPTKLNHDGKLIDHTKMKENAEKVEENLEKEIDKKRDEKREKEEKQRELKLAKAEQSIDENDLSEEQNDKQKIEDEFEEDMKKKKFQATAQYDHVINVLSVLNLYYDDDAIFSQKLWLEQNMLNVQESWIKFMLKAKRGVKMRRENLKKPFKDLYRGGDEALVFDLPDDLLGEFGPKFSMMNASQDIQQLYIQVDEKNLFLLAKKTQRYSQALQYRQDLQSFYEKLQKISQIISKSKTDSETEQTQRSHVKDYYTRFPEHIILVIKYQFQIINYFENNKAYIQYFEQDYEYKKLEDDKQYSLMSPMKQPMYILNQLIEHHTEETQLLIFTLCCPDKNLSDGEIVDDNKELIMTKNSWKAITLGLYDQKLSMLTESNLKYTIYLKRITKEKKESRYYNEDEQMTRENFWKKLASIDRVCSTAFLYIYHTSLISKTFAMYNQTIMISSLDTFTRLKLEQKKDVNKFFRNLCENNCLFFKDFFFHLHSARSDNDVEKESKYSTCLIDTLVEFIQYFNKDKKFLGYWSGKKDQYIYRHKLFQRNKSLINFYKHVLYLIYEIMDGLITNHNVESQLIFDEFLEKLVNNQSYMGLKEMVTFLFEVDFNRQADNSSIEDGSINQNKISDLSLEQSQQHAKKQLNLYKSQQSHQPPSNMIEMAEQPDSTKNLSQKRKQKFKHSKLEHEQVDQMESELLSEIYLMRQGFLRLLTLPIKNKMTKNNFFAESLISLVDFESELDQVVESLVRFVNLEIYRKSETNIVTHDDFITLYKGNKNFRDNAIYQEIVVLIHLILALSDINITLEKKRKILGIVSVLKRYGLKSPNDRDLEIMDCGESIKPQTRECLQFLAKVIQRIEILVPQNQLISTDRDNKIVLFESPPQVFFLQGERRDEYMEIIDQENPRQDLMKYSEVLLLDMDHNFDFYQKSSVRYYFLQDSSITLQKQILWAFSLAINVVCLVTYKLSEVDGKNDRDQRKLESESWKWVVNIASFALAGYSLILLVLWLCFKMPIQFDIAKEFYFISTASMRGKELGFWSKVSFIYHTFTYESAMINMIFHVVFGILGPLLDPFFHALHLILFVNISSSAMYILKASTNRLGLLVNTLFMAIFLIFAYSILTANYYSDKLGELDDKNIDACATLASCFLYSFSIGLQNPLGDKMTPYDYATESKFGTKLVFDITFFIFINTIILNMVFGIITDAFGEMRDKSYERMESIENTCLICQNKRGNIEETNVNFKNHIHFDHAYFLYVNFIKYIKEKDNRNFTADEVCVFKDIEAGKVDWMPLSKSLYLEGMEEDEDLLKEKLYDQVASIEKGMKLVTTKLEDLLKIAEKH